MVDELVSLGHEVTLFASGDSTTSARLNAVWPGHFASAARVPTRWPPKLHCWKR
jgi:hypothetical protein